MAIIYYDGLDVNGTVDLTNLTVSSAQGTAGQVLTSTGSGVAWEDAGGGSGTVTSITATSGALGGLTGGTITTSGSIALDYSGNNNFIFASDVSAGRQVKYIEKSDLLEDQVTSVTTGEPSGSDQVINIVSLTQAEYDAGTPVATSISALKLGSTAVTKAYLGSTQVFPVASGVASGSITAGQVRTSNGTFACTQFSTSGSGTGATFNITFVNKTPTAISSITNGGSGYAVNDTIDLQVGSLSASFQNPRVEITVNSLG